MLFRSKGMAPDANTPRLSNENYNGSYLTNVKVETSAELTPEFVNQIAELSKHTLRSYVSKGAKDAIHKLDKADDQKTPAQKELAAQGHKRMENVKKAIKKVAEDVAHEKQIIKKLDKIEKEEEHEKNCKCPMCKPKLKVKNKVVENIDIDPRRYTFQDYVDATRIGYGIADIKALPEDQQRRFWGIVDALWEERKFEVILETIVKQELMEKVKAHKAAGRHVSDIKMKGRDGEVEHSFVVHHEDGKHVKHVVHGRSKK